MKRKPRKLRMEALQARQMMAGDVTFSDGVLEVRMSDHGSDHLYVGGNAGHVQVAGNASLDHRGSNRVPIDQVRSIRVIGTDGADDIDLRGIRARNFPQQPQITVISKAGDDTIQGSDLADTIFAGRHNDTVFGNGGDDTIYGQRGHDTLYGLSGNDTIKGGRGHDKIMGGNGRDSLYGGSGNDRLYGHSPHHADGVRDRIFGGSGHDYYEGHFRDRDSVRGVETVKIF